MVAENFKILLPFVLGLLLVVQPVLCGNYYVMAPNFLHVGSIYPVTVGIIDTPLGSGNVQVTVRLKSADGSLLHEKVKSIDRGASEIFEFSISPSLKENSVKLELNGTGAAEFMNDTDIKVEEKTGIIMIRTDKDIYKPGQIVLMQIFLMDIYLRPLKSNVTISIKDGNGNKVQQWKDVETVSGVVSQEIQLSDDPVLKQWTITVISDGMVQERHFIVDKYVLPRFEVVMHTEPVVSEKDKDLIVNVESKYTFGKYVYGTLKMEVQMMSMPVYYFDFAPLGRPPSRGGQQVNKIIDSLVIVDFSGSSIIKYNIADLKQKANMYADSNYDWEISIIAYVTEDGSTEAMESDPKVVKVFPQDFLAKFVDMSPKVYHPGLNLYASLKITNIKQQPLNGPEVHVLVTKSVDSVQETSRHSVPVDGVIHLTFSLPKIMSSLEIKAVVQSSAGQNLTFAYLPLSKYMSLQNDSIQLTRISSYDFTSEMRESPDQVIPARGSVRFQVTATFPMTNLFYVVIGRGKVIRFNSLSVSSNMTSFSFSVDSDMAPHFYIMVFSFVKPVKGKHEMLADGQVYGVDFSLDNKVSISFNKDEAKVKEEVTLTIIAAPNSWFGIKAVDKAVLLLSGSTDIDSSRVLAALAGLNFAKKKSEDMCRFSFCSRSPMNAQSKSASSFFEDFGLVYMTDTFVEIPDLQNRDRGPVLMAAVDALADGMVQRSSAEATGQIDDSTVRRYFPETWLWHSGRTSANGSQQMTFTVPDSLTTWKTSAIAISEDKGLGISNTELVAFQKFFIQAVLKYSLIRGESALLEIIVFNYFKEKITADVILDASEEFGINLYADQKPDEAVSQTLREVVEIPSQRQGRVSIWIVPRVLGKIQLKIQAISSGVRDQLFKTILIEPEGEESYHNRQWLIFFESDQEGNMTFIENIQEDYPAGEAPVVVKGSWKVDSILIGNILGQLISGLGGIVRMPMGCGEQNMIYMVPSVMVFKFYASTGKFNSEIIEKTKKYTETGYQRELNFRLHDGSFSAFTSDKNGSTWLSAFVLKSFCQAKEFVYIDPDVIRNTAAWLINKQNVSGMFQEDGRVIHEDMQGGTPGSEETMAAYILIALQICYPNISEHGGSSYLQTMQTALDLTKNVLKNKFIKGTLQKKPYTLALVAYALQLAGEVDTVSDILKELDKLSIFYDGKKSWSMAKTSKLQPRHYGCRSNGAPFAVEISSYVLLTYAHRGDVAAGFPILKFLMSLSNPFGGFCSTQDTVMGIQALYEFSKVMFNDGQLDVALTPDKGVAENFTQVTPSNNNLLQRMILPADTKQIKVDVSGRGVAILQVIWKYHKMPSTTDSGLKTEVNIKAKDKDTISFDLCVRYDDEENIGMSTIQVKMLTGFSASLGTNQLKDAAKTEVKDDSVIIYMNEVTTKKSCFYFDAVRTDNIADIQPAIIKFSSYYKPGIEKVVSYNLPEGAIKSKCELCAGQCKCSVVDASSYLTWSSLTLIMAAILATINQL